MFICLGWGSLVWNPQALPIKGHWNKDGPELPVEFLRHSGGDRLTLVIHASAPKVPVLWAELDVASLAEAVEALRVREGCPTDQPIARIPASKDYPYSSDIAKWAASRDIHGTVWTALGPRFDNHSGQMPTVEQAIDFLQALPPEKYAGAEEYVRNAPTQIRTPYRRAFEERLGWRPASSD